MSSALLLIGGGRWARVYLSVLAGMSSIPDRIVVVSRHGGHTLDDAIAAASRFGSKQIALFSTLDDALERCEPRAAVVANAARDHVATGLALLERGIPVLLEKPVALDVAAAQRLIDAARRSGAALVPGLVLSFCEYLHNFAAAARSEIGQVRGIAVEWSDPAGESRYDEAKGFDAGLGVVEEIGPHIWTLLTTVVAGDATQASQAEIRNGGLGIRLRGSASGVDFDVTLKRQAAVRRRFVSIVDQEGRTATLDFSGEPGVIAVGDRSRNADPEWPTRPGPLALQLAKFVQSAERPPEPRDLDAVRGSTSFVSGAADLVRRAQQSWLKSPSGAQAELASRRVAVREMLAPLLVEAGFVPAGDNRTLDAGADAALKIIAGDQSAPASPELHRLLAVASLVGHAGG